jgi:hypothetical protein
VKEGRPPVFKPLKATPIEKVREDPTSSPLRRDFL